MIKRFVNLFLCATIFLCLSSPVFATSNDSQSSAPKSVEDILGEYYEKQMHADNSVTGYSRSASEKTLEQETVDTLNEAGYEAYNVTESNYDYLEKLLKTDFSSMGLDRSNSYVVVISSEEIDHSSASIRGNLPEYDIIDPGDNGFLYYYEPFDTYYSMRYFTIAYETQTATVNVVSSFGSSYANSLANSNITGTVKSNSVYTSEKTLGTLRSLWGLNTSATYSNPTLSITCSVNWTRKYIQVYDESIDNWTSTTYSEYASTTTKFAGKYLNNSTSAYDTVSYTAYATIYSPNYGNSETMKEKAVMFYTAINPTYDRTQEIQVKTTDQSGSTKILVTVSEDF